MVWCGCRESPLLGRKFFYRCNHVLTWEGIFLYLCSGCDDIRRNAPEVALFCTNTKTFVLVTEYRCTKAKTFVFVKVRYCTNTKTFVFIKVRYCTNTKPIVFVKETYCTKAKTFVLVFVQVYTDIKPKVSDSSQPDSNSRKKFPNPASGISDTKPNISNTAHSGEGIKKKFMKPQTLRTMCTQNKKRMPRHEAPSPTILSLLLEVVSYSDTQDSLVEIFYQVIPKLKTNRQLVGGINLST